MTPAPRLFATCPLPGCRELVADPREPCPECRHIFGPTLRPSVGEGLSAAEFVARAEAADRRVAAVLAERVAMSAPPAAGEWRRSQRCWCCEERRTCRPDPGLPGRLICRECLAIDPADIPAE